MTAFFMAWMMFLWIPSPSHKWDENKKKEMLLCMPLVGLILGALWMLMASFCRRTLGSALLAAAPWLITGFMHIDGYMDCADAVLSFKDHEKKLQILKDTHVGSFAVVSMVILGMLQLAACIQIDPVGKGAAFLFIPALTRCVSVARVLRWEALPTSSYVHLTEGVKTVHKIVPALMALAFLTALFFLCGWKVCAAVCIGLCVQMLVMRYLRGNLGGMSGDISGSGIVTGELACLMALAMV